MWLDRILVAFVYIPYSGVPSLPHGINIQPHVLMAFNLALNNHSNFTFTTAVTRSRYCMGFSHASQSRLVCTDLDIWRNISLGLALSDLLAPAPR